MRLNFIEPDETKGTLREIFQKLIMVPNILCLMANSEAVINSYAHSHANQRFYKLSEKYRKMVSLAVSQYNDCSYCIALHTSTAIGGGLLTSEECLDARRMKSNDPKTNVLLRFTQQILEYHGKIKDVSINEMKKFDFEDQEIVELIAVVSFITMANLTANVGKPELDFIEAPVI